jgi:hypothetical protein
VNIVAPDTPEIWLARGSVRLNAACYARYFGGTQGIILLYEAELRRLWVLPMRSVRAGGSLLKQVNMQGDRAAATHGFSATMIFRKIWRRSSRSAGIPRGSD